MMMMMMVVVVVVMIMMKNTKYGAPRYAVVCRLLSPFHAPYVQCSPQHPVLQHPESVFTVT
jgi:hypothetical protein